MKRFIPGAIALALILPSLAYAQNLGNLQTLLGSVGNLVGLALPIVMGLALLAFFWGLVKYIFNRGNEEESGNAKSIMIWAVVALFVMVSIWGLVEFIQSALGISPTDVPNATPTVPGL